MSTQNAKTINQKEYLKKYLSGDKEKKKKNKKHKKTTHAKVKIIDDDAHDSNNEEIDEDLLLGGEDAPQIVGEYIEENPNAVRSKWRNIAATKIESDTETNGNDGHVDENPAEDESFLWGKASTIKIKKELSPSGRPHDIHSPAIQIKHEKRSSSSDRSPAAIRIKQEKRSSSRDQSPERIRRKSKERSLQRKRRDSDQSPPRRRLDSDPITLRKSRNSDQSPLRRRREKDPSPPRKQRYSDQSPPRRRRETDQSPPRRQRDSDQSPSRRQREKDQSPPRKQRDSDQSPPRRRRETDQSPPRRQRDSDQSPPRRRRDGDLSPCRRRQSPPRRRPSLEQSPPRRRHSSTRDRRQPTYPRRQHSPDQSPPRRIKKEERGSPSPPYERKSRWSKEKRCRTPSPPPTHKPKTKHTLDGKKAGLQDAQSLKIETDMRRREEHKMFDQMSSEVSGRDAEVRVRSTGRRGRRARDAAAEDPEEQKRKEAHELKKKELYDRWGKGLKQLEDQHARHAEMTHEAAKPVARYANDEDLDRHLREQEHADDPMLKYMQEKRRKLELKSDKPVMPVYSGSYPENRFGIRPGYRWDGVDRSNGYEQRWFNKQNERRAVQDEAYKYSVEDM